MPLRPWLYKMYLYLLFYRWFSVLQWHADVAGFVSLQSSLLRWELLLSGGLTYGRRRKDISPPLYVVRYICLYCWDMIVLLVLVSWMHGMSPCPVEQEQKSGFTMIWDDDRNYFWPKMFSTEDVFPIIGNIYPVVLIRITEIIWNDVLAPETWFWDDPQGWCPDQNLISITDSSYAKQVDIFKRSIMLILVKPRWVLSL